MSALSPSQQEGLQKILSLMEAHNLTPADVKKSAAESKKEKKHGGAQISKSELILRLFVYLGGTLIFAGLGVFIKMIWGDIGSMPRVIITFGSGFTAFLCGLVFAKDTRFEKAATPAFIVSFLMQPFGLFVLLKEYFPGDNPALGAILVFGILTVQQALTFVKFKFPSLLLFSLIYSIGFGGAFVEYFDLDRGLSCLIFGLFLLLVTLDMQLRNRVKDLTPVFFFFSTGLFLSGVYYYIGRTVYDPVALSLVYLMLGFAVARESKTLYVLSLLYIAAYFCGGPGGGWYAGWSEYNKLAAIFTGSSLLLAGHWLKKSSYISLYPLWMFVGCAYALGGTYGLLHQTVFEPLYVGINALAIYGALMLRSRAVLAASVLSLISFIVAYSAEHFANTVGWPLLLIFLGFVILTAGFMFARLAGRIKDAAA